MISSQILLFEIRRKAGRPELCDNALVPLRLSPDNSMPANEHSKAIYVHACTIASALGFDPAETLRRLSAPVEAHPNEFRMNLHGSPELSEADRLISEALASGRLDPAEKSGTLRVMTALAAPLAARIRKAGFKSEDVGVVAGAATSSLSEAIENEGKDPANDAGLLPLEIGNSASALAGIFGFAGPAYVISTACTAGAKAIADAARLLLCGRTEAVIAGGVDLASNLAQTGFETLGAASASCPKPFMQRRDGLKLGDGGGFLLLATKPDLNGVPAIAKLEGFGETGGAERAMKDALRSAALRPADIDFILLHGGSTVQIDVAEAAAVYAAFGPSTPCASLKGRVGHQLAGSGAFSAAAALAMIEASHHDGCAAWPCRASASKRKDLLDEALRNTPIALAGRPGVPRKGRVRRVLVNAFALSGCASLIFSEAAPEMPDAAVSSPKSRLPSDFFREPER